MDTMEEEPLVIKDVGIKPKKKLGIKQKIGIICAVLAVAAILYPIMSIVMRIYNRSRYRDEFFLQEDVAKYLEDRYDEEFIVMFNRGMSGAYNYVQLYAYPITNKTKKIQIQGYYNKKGKLDYFDDYVMIKLTDEYEAYVDEIIKQYYKKYKFFMEFYGEWITSNLPPDTKLEDLWELRANQDYPLPAVFIYLSPEEQDKEQNRQKVSEFLNCLKDNHYRGRVDIWYMKQDGRYQLANANNWEDIMEYRDYKDVVTYFIYSNEIKVNEITPAEE